MSSVTGAGVKEFFEAVEASREEYEKDYLPDLQRARKRKEETLAAAKKDSMDRLLKDLALDREKDPEFAARDRWDAEDDDDDDQDDSDINIVDRSKWCARPIVKHHTHHESRLGPMARAICRPHSSSTSSGRTNQLAQTRVILAPILTLSDPPGVR